MRHTTESCLGSGENSEHADLVVFDEIMAAVNYGMVPERDVLEFLENRPGRDQTDGWRSFSLGEIRREKLGDRGSGLCLEICKRKHPFDRCHCPDE